MYTISHNINGFSARAILGKDLKREIYETFSYAVSCYGFHVKLHETISGEEWIKRIESYYENSPRIQAVINSIKIAMPYEKES